MVQNGDHQCRKPVTEAADEKATLKDEEEHTKVYPRSRSSIQMFLNFINITSPQNFCITDSQLKYLSINFKELDSSKSSTCMDVNAVQWQTPQLQKESAEHTQVPCFPERVR